ncbi:Methionine import system permease protein MetP [Bacteroidales bacterium Barb6]|nr:Methionine import system permease protein MetP [Bacteroidales bacterium Barb6XT]OAV68066.1 Methionine import system permease protein MetP [Bacteroidales bacterium Barb4]OAV70846.1 Methionine import system permease protein MetP [Bacteroidales bacterium Barb6]OAV75185.1 Methionine import system permease protein MetP [Bacteroidales bacterium Barb7]
MIDISFLQLLSEIKNAFLETFFMCGVTIGISVVMGLLLGLFIFVTNQGEFWENKALNRTGGFLINVVRSIPFIILLVVLLPFTKFLIGTSIGPLAATVSLTVASTAYFARLVESSLCEVDKGVLEAAKALGASHRIIVWDVLLPEALPGIYRGLTIMTIGLLGNSANAGMVGGGGIGDLAIRFGYYRYQTDVMVIAVVLLIVLVQIIQTFGDWIAKRADRAH